MDLIEGGDGTAAQDVVEVGLGVEAAATGAFDEGVVDGGGFAGFGIADEEIVLFADGAGSDGVFDEVVVEFDPAVFQIAGEAVPLAEGIVEGLAKGAFGQVPSAGFEPEQGVFHPPQDGDGLDLTKALPGFGAGLFAVRVGLAQGFLDLIEVLDLPQEPAGADGGFGEGVVEVAPDVGHAGAQPDAPVVFVGEGGVGSVAITLQDAFPFFREDFVKACGGAAGKPVEDGVAAGPVDRP